MTPTQACESVHWGKPISCTAEQWPKIRVALCVTGLDYETSDDHARATIVRAEIIRLDSHFEALAVAPPEPEIKCDE